MGDGALGYSREQFLLIQLVGVVCSSAVTIPLAALLAERGRRRMLMWVDGGDRRCSAW